jgi:hypothetical protein
VVRLCSDVFTRLLIVLFDVRISVHSIDSLPECYPTWVSESFPKIVSIVRLTPPTMLSIRLAMDHVEEGRTCAHNCRQGTRRSGKRFVGDCPRAQTFGLVVDDSIVPDAAVSLSVCHRPWSGLPFYDPSPVWVYRSYLPQSHTPIDIICFPICSLVSLVTSGRCSPDAEVDDVLVMCPT